MDINWNSLKNKLLLCNETVSTDNFVGAVTTSMPRTFLLGNGDIALISAGKGDKKEFLISKGDFWSCGNCSTDDPMKINPNKLTHITFGGISFKGFSGDLFTETLDIASGALTTKKGGIILETICDQGQNAALFKFNSENGITLEIELWAKSDIKEYPTFVKKNGEQYFVGRKTANTAMDNTNSWTSIVSAGLISDGELNYLDSGEHSVKYSIKLVPKKDTYVIMAIGGGGKTLDNIGNLISAPPDSEVRDILKKFENEKELETTKTHIKEWWKEYWLRSFVDISDDVVEKYYYGSMYLLACFARKGKRVTGLYGNFVTTDNPKWQNDFHLNYNFIAPYYGAYASNRCDFAEGLAQPLVELIPEGKKRALQDLRKICKGYINGGFVCKEFFNGRKDLKNGIENAVLFPVGIAPYGFVAWNENGGYLSQMYDAAFTSTCIATYYSFTLDGEYLKKCEELLRLIVNFYIGWREKQTDKNGIYVYNIWSGAHEGTFEKNTPGAIGAIKNILQCLLTAAARGDIVCSSEDIKEWTDFLNHLAPYAIKNFKLKKMFKTIFDKPIVYLGEKGLKISIGQTIALEFIHPAYDMDFFTDKLLITASRNLVELNKLKNSHVYEQCNAFPKNFTHAIMCQTPADEVVNDFKNVLKKQFCYNYSVDDGDTHGVEKCGATEFVHAMLIRSSGDTIEVFPNAPKGKCLQFISLRARGAFLVSARRNENEKVEYVEIISKKLFEIRLVNPFNSPVVTNPNGEIISYTIKSEKGLNILTFKACNNIAYLIKDGK